MLLRRVDMNLLDCSSFHWLGDCSTFFWQQFIFYTCFIKDAFNESSIKEGLLPKNTIIKLHDMIASNESTLYIIFNETCIYNSSNSSRGKRHWSNWSKTSRCNNKTKEVEEMPPPTSSSRKGRGMIHRRKNSIITKKKTRQCRAEKKTVETTMS